MVDGCDGPSKAAGNSGRGKELNEKITQTTDKTAQVEMDEMNPKVWSVLRQAECPNV